MSVYSLGDLKSRVYDRLENNVELYPQAQVVSEINNAIRSWNLFVGEVQDTRHVPGYSVAGQILYSVPTGIIAPFYVYCEGRQLNLVPLKVISRLRRDWMRETTQYYGPVMNWIPIGLSTFAIHPIDHIGGKDIEVSGLVEPTLLVNDEDSISIPDKDADVITDLATVNLAFVEGGKTFADISMLYTQVLSRMKKRAAWAGMRMPMYWIIKQKE